MELLNTNLVLVLLSLVVAGFAAVFVYFGPSLTGRKVPSYRAKPSKTIPLPPSTEIVELRIYPVKSCRGFNIQKTNLLKSGLELDRQWMLVEYPSRKFLTIRAQSRMTLITTSLDVEGDKLVISTEPDPSIRIEVPAHPSKDWLEKNTTAVEAEIWKTNTAAREYSEEVTKDLAKFLGQDLRLVYKGPYTAPRIVGGDEYAEILGRKQGQGFADMMPVLVANKLSMEELNSRLRTANVENPFSIHRFRPNVIVKGIEPWYEDKWLTLRMSPTPEMKLKPLVLDVTLNCARCLVPNVDPLTAEKNPKQPWDTLMKYRRIDEGIKFKPCFGMLCCPREEGEIRVGMKLDVLEVTEGHRFPS